MKALSGIVLIWLGFWGQAALAHSPFLDHQLREAAGLGDATYVRSFLQQGAEVNSTDRNGASALSEAVANSPSNVSAYLEVIDELLNAGADVNLDWPYASHGAHGTLHRVPIFFGSLLTDETGRRLIDQRVVAKLVQSPGADLERTNENGHTALYYASETDDAEAIPLLAAAGADINRASSGRTDLGFSPLMAAIRNGAADAFEALLLLPGLALETRAYDGSTPLSLARVTAKHSNQSFWVDDLVSHGAN